MSTRTYESGGIGTGIYKGAATARYGAPGGYWRPGPVTATRQAMRHRTGATTLRVPTIRHHAPTERRRPELVLEVIRKGHS